MGTVENRHSHRHSMIHSLGNAVFIYIIAGFFKFLADIRIFVVNLKAQSHSSPAQMYFQNLSNIHTARYAQRIQYDLYRFAIRQERHILTRQNTGYNALVTMTTGHLIAFGNLTFLYNMNSNLLIYSRWQIIAIFPGKYFSTNNNT